MNFIEKKYSEQTSPTSNREVNKILHHIDLDSRGLKSNVDGYNQWKQQFQSHSNGNSPTQQASQSSPKFQANEYQQGKIILINENEQRKYGIKSEYGGERVSSSNPNQGQIRYNNFQSFSPLQNDSIQEEYYLKNQIENPIQQYQQNLVMQNNTSKYTPDKKRSSQSPSPFRLSELQTTQFNLNLSNLDVKNSRAYLKAMKALQNKVKEIENVKQTEIDMLRKNNEDKNEIIKSLTFQVSEQKIALEKLEKKFQKEQDIFIKLENNLKGKLKAVEKENDEYIQHCNFYKSEIEQLKEKISQVEQLSKQELKSLLKEKSYLKEQINVVNNEEQLWKEKIKDLQLQNTHLLENMDSQEIKYRHMEQSFKIQINENESDIKLTLKQIQYQLLEKDDSIKRLKQDNVTLNQDLEMTRQKFNDLTTQFDGEKGKNKSFEEENKQLCEKIQEILKDNENMRSFCQATREMNNKLLNSFSTNRLNETQINQTLLKNRSQNHHSFSQSGNFYASNLSEIPQNQNINIQEDYQPINISKPVNRNSSSNLLQHISSVASAGYKKNIPLNENKQITQQLNYNNLLPQDKYYLNQGLSFTGSIRKDDTNQQLQRKDEYSDENQEIKQQRFTQQQAITSSNSLKNMQFSQQSRNHIDENSYNLSRQRSLNTKDNNKLFKAIDFSECKDKNSQETFRTTAQISVNYQDNQQLKTRYEYEQVIQAVLDTEKQLVELNHTYQKLAQDTYNYEGEDIYITVLRKKLMDLKEKIQVKSDFLDEMKNRECVLAQSFLQNL